MRSVVVTACVELGSPPAKVWPLLADTDRTNRALGMAPVTYAPIDVEAEGATSARFLASTSAGGFRLSYEEQPFEWQHERRFRVARAMRSGPLTAYSLEWDLEPSADGGTRAAVRLELVPRFALLRPIAWLNAKRFVAQLLGHAEAIDAHLREGAPSPYAALDAAVDLGQLADAVVAMKKDGAAEGLADRLADFVRAAPDADLARIRPFELADAWGEDRRDVLRAFLRGVPAGLFELRWGIVCPSCLTSSQEVKSLEEISREGHCQMCDLTFDLDLDRAVEATFVPHPSVRRVATQLFCIGGPGRTPHVLLQAIVAAGETRALPAPSAPGRYRLFARGGASATIEVTASGARDADVKVGESGASPARLEVAPGAAIAVTNEAGAPRHVKIERLEYASAAATAHVVTTMGDFRTLFTSDLLKRSTPLKVARVAILFSDLTGSTALYSRVGDAAAFRLVDDHFDVLRSVIDEHGGAVVKTMGDAVMAGFVDPRQCARAAVAALVRFEGFRAERSHGDLIGLKLGMYAGPCYVVTANGALDYFGQTVNVASRVQHLAGSGEVIMTADQHDALSAEARARLAVVERFEARVKGIDQPLALVRLRAGESVVPQPPLSRRAVPGVST